MQDAGVTTYRELKDMANDCEKSFHLLKTNLRIVKTKKQKNVAVKRILHEYLTLIGFYRYFCSRDDCFDSCYRLAYPRAIGEVVTQSVRRLYI